MAVLIPPCSLVGQGAVGHCDVIVSVLGGERASLMVAERVPWEKRNLREAVPLVTLPPGFSGRGTHSRPTWLPLQASLHLAPPGPPGGRPGCTEPPPPSPGGGRLPPRCPLQLVSLSPDLLLRTLPPSSTSPCLLQAGPGTQTVLTPFGSRGDSDQPWSPPCSLAIFEMIWSVALFSTLRALATVCPKRGQLDLWWGTEGGAPDHQERSEIGRITKESVSSLWSSVPG